jgi:hypothetical protein
VEELEHALTRLRAQEAGTLLEAEAPYALVEQRPLRPVSREQQRDAVESGERLERDAERLLGAQTAAEGERGTVHPEGRPQLLARRQPGDDRRRVRDHAHALGRQTPPDRELPQERARAEHVGCPAQPQPSPPDDGADAQAAAAPLELGQVAVEPPPSDGPLVRRVARDLDNERTARESSSERSPRRHARRVDDIAHRCAPGDQQRDKSVTDPDRPAPRGPAHLIGLFRRRRVRGHHYLHSMAASVQKLRELGRMARRASHVRRPDPGHDENVQCVTASRGEG